MAFDRSEDGELLAAFGPVDEQSEERAVRLAKTLATKHVGVIAWFREGTRTSESMARHDAVREGRPARDGIAMARQWSSPTMPAWRCGAT
jgi:hypothetical protein